MPTITNSLEVPAAPDTVWQILGDLTRYGEWNVAHTDFPDGTPELAQDVRFREKLTLMGMPGEATWTVADFDAPRRLVFDGEGPMGIKLGQTIDLAGASGATKVSLETSFEGGPLTGSLGDALAKSASQAATESLERLRGLIAAAD